MSETAPRLAVVIATKGRPQATSALVRSLEQQSLPPSLIVISATDREDIEEPLLTGLNVQCIFGSPGLPAQRNLALRTITDGYDVVIFFDDDFVPAPEWIERCANLLLSEPEVIGVSGSVLADGAYSQEVSYRAADILIQSAREMEQGAAVLVDSTDLYGCNMGFRMSAIRGIEFDERLVMYGWLEDMDFSRTAAKRGRTVYCSSLIGVHLGIKSGRVSGRRYGFSQVVNPWYLHRKGTLAFRQACGKIIRALASNSVKSVRPEEYVDRFGRLRGNLIGVRHLLSGNCRPEHATEL